MQTWLLQTLSDVLNRYQEIEDEGEIVEIKPKTARKQLESNCGERKRLAELKAQREWVGAIAAL